MTTHHLVTVGVDVGGPRKGFHAVALRRGKYWSKTSTLSAAEMDHWCRELGASVIGVDAPCRWSATGRARPAERELMKAGIACFSTPTRTAAQGHPKNYFGWMLAGAELYSSLERRYALYNGSRILSGHRVCFETFPQAIACAIAGEKVSAKKKCRVRRELLRQVGIDTSLLTNIDLVDAALCALAAQEFAKGATVDYGEAETGFIVVPR